MNINHITDFLREFSQKHHLKQEAIESCQECLKNCTEKELGGYSPDEVLIKYNRQTFIFDSNKFNYDFPYIRTRLYLHEKATYTNSWQATIGYYDLDTDMNGKHFDDWLVITEEKIQNNS